MFSIRDTIDVIDAKIAKSTFARVFRLDGSGHEKERPGSKFVTEIRAGITTFFTMAYIIAVNASVLTESGGTCVCTSTTDPSCSTDADYAQCLIGINRDLVTATAALAGLGSIVFGFLTNLPVALGPGMGLNAYFTYQVVGYHGTGPVSYKLALMAVFVEGFIFVFLSLVGMRQWLVKIIPASIKTASGVGIGLFLTEIGLSYSAGIGAITGSSVTPTNLGGCPTQYLAADGSCSSHQMQNPSMWIGILCGGMVTSYLMAYRYKCAIIIGIALVSIMSWPRNTAFTYFPHTAEGDTRFEFFKKVVDFHPIQHTLAVQEWNVSKAGNHFALALFTFLYVDIVDCTATLYSMARFSGVVDPETGDFPRSTLAYCTDAIMISIGSVFGCSPVTAFIESGAGITEGGRTGLTAIVTGTCFLISIFFAPIFASIPPWATGCTLILVGCLMMRQVVNINWIYIGDALPAFVTIVCMPFTYSAAYGLIAGLMVYTILNSAIALTRIVSKGRIQPPDADSAEYWTYKPHGGVAPWFVRVVQNRGRFWDHPIDDVFEVNSVEETLPRRQKEMVTVRGGGLGRSASDASRNTESRI
ncbi:hypothetical protein BP6252_07605 [Coleophoma cylindrospora]|uniref:Uncharacterized protein n=1 Tax=Coleophoma cylindrospora TaxID=1849047 RepID=A0A3D8RAG5_9HELO|nr:hypothetical protein BP6252_07605 [Coleophoma cylindrospora]